MNICIFNISQEKKWFNGQNLRFLEEKFRENPFPSHEQY